MVKHVRCCSARRTPHSWVQPPHKSFMFKCQIDNIIMTHTHTHTHTHTQNIFSFGSIEPLKLPAKMCMFMLSQKNRFSHVSINTWHETKTCFTLPVYLFKSYVLKFISMIKSFFVLF